MPESELSLCYIYSTSKVVNVIIQEIYVSAKDLLGWALWTDWSEIMKTPRMNGFCQRETNNPMTGGSEAKEDFRSTGILGVEIHICTV